MALPDSKKFIRVKVMGLWAEAIHQLPDGRLWGNCCFTFDPDDRAYDWLVVYNDVPRQANERPSMRIEPLACLRRNTLLVTTEPPNVKVYGHGFTAQFGHVLTTHPARDLPHPHRIFSQPALVWYYGHGRDGVMIPYNALREPPLAKTKMFSTVCSSKAQRHTLHHRRYALTQAVKKAVPELDIYGRGVRSVNDKAEALDGYKYHLAVENYIGAHHWTEKLSDAFLGATLPFYGGAPNAAEYFPKDSFIPIDVYDVPGAIQTIQDAIRGNEYEKRLPAIMEARRRVLEEYNFFAVVAGIVERENQAGVALPGEVMRSRRQTLKAHPLTEGVRYGFEKTRRRLVNWLFT